MRIIGLAVIAVVLAGILVVAPASAQDLSELIPPITITAQLSGCWTVVARVQVVISISGENPITLMPKDISVFCTRGERTVSFTFTPDGAGGGTLSYSNGERTVSFTFTPDGAGGGTLSYSNVLENSSVEISYTRSGGETVVWLILGRSW